MPALHLGFVEDAGEVALPFAAVFRQQVVSQRRAALHPLVQHGKEAGLVRAPRQLAARRQHLQQAERSASDVVEIDEMLNKSRGDIAYTIVDSSQPVPESVIARLRAIDGVLRVRYLAPPVATA